MPMFIAIVIITEPSDHCHPHLQHAQNSIHINWKDLQIYLPAVSNTTSIDNICHLHMLLANLLLACTSSQHPISSISLICFCSRLWELYVSSAFCGIFLHSSGSRSKRGKNE